MKSASATTAPNSLNRVFLGIGGNLGDRLGNLRRAVELIGERIGKIEKVSSVYLSEPWGFKHAKYFTNIVAEVYTAFSADEVLTKAFEIETELKRTRSGNGYEGRTMDIDILFFNSEIINTERLIVPHPHICQRLFVLLPMQEIEPDFVHPQNDMTMKELAKICNDAGKIRRLGAKFSNISFC
jgi:2-amino-4-hydroxy-6-hydroxymethyldihydropteridine pyrophosphokinase